jgi:hypothetical protein
MQISKGLGHFFASGTGSCVPGFMHKCVMELFSGRGHNVLGANRRNSLAENGKGTRTVVRITIPSVLIEHDNIPRLREKLAIHFQYFSHSMISRKYVDRLSSCHGAEHQDQYKVSHA